MKLRINIKDENTTVLSWDYERHQWISCFSLPLDVFLRLALPEEKERIKNNIIEGKTNSTMLEYDTETVF